MVRISKQGIHKDKQLQTLQWCMFATLFATVLVVGCFYVGTFTLLGRKKIAETAFVANALSAANLQISNKPYLIYGTAWKKEQTSQFVSDAIHAGFRFIDTACQPKHYNEAGVGDGWVHATQSLKLRRQDIFLQTKFTSLDGQDPKRIPYDEQATLEQQVQQSLETSLSNLKTTYLDSLVLHSPMRSTRDTLRVWNEFESFVDDGKVKQLGISNCYDYKLFVELYDTARIKPSFLQNRFYETSQFDVKLRHFCHDKNIKYQSFWTLTGNREALNTLEMKVFAKEKNLTPQTLMYAFMMTLGHTPLDGTQDVQHMKEDVEVMRRIQGGESIFHNFEEVEKMGKMLGVPV